MTRVKQPRIADCAESRRPSTARIVPKEHIPSKHRCSANGGSHKAAACNAYRDLGLADVFRPQQRHKRHTATCWTTSSAQLHRFPIRA
mmetsp:Transcript_7039/g.18862  ORF Transcript_7039/g.18862 Transcript_7039/m.18862 type:complete len:88 (+) Transcript_7039:120-383(+)